MNNYLTMKILSCNSNKELAESIASYIGVKLCKASIRKFADDEIFVLEEGLCSESH